jgi:hypothetical protein
MPELKAYAATVGAMRAYADQSDGQQPGDPAKAAKAIVDAVTTGTSTLRLPLGPDAPGALREKLAQVKAEVDRTEQIALSTGF